MKKFRRFRLVKKFPPVAREELAVPVTSLDSLDDTDEDTTTSATEKLFRRAFAQIVERAEESFQVAGSRAQSHGFVVNEDSAGAGDENLTLWGKLLICHGWYQLVYDS